MHLIQFEVLINPKNKRHFHHVLVFECEEWFQTDDSVGIECGSVPLPTNIGYGCMQKQLIAWGIGGQYVCYSTKNSHLLIKS